MHKIIARAGLGHLVERPEDVGLEFCSDQKFASAHEPPIGKPQHAVTGSATVKLARIVLPAGNQDRERGCKTHAAEQPKPLPYTHSSSRQKPP